MVWWYALRIVLYCTPYNTLISKAKRKSGVGIYIYICMWIASTQLWEGKNTLIWLCMYVWYCPAAGSNCCNLFVFLLAFSPNQSRVTAFKRELLSLESDWKCDAFSLTWGPLLLVIRVLMSDSSYIIHRIINTNSNLPKSQQPQLVALALIGLLPFACVSEPSFPPFLFFFIHLFLSYIGVARIETRV